MALRDEEQLAADVLSRILSADRIEPRDVDGAGTHDFDLWCGSRRIAVEVTAAVDERLIQQAAEIGSPAIEATAASGTWYVTVRSRINRLKPQLDSMLAAAEEDGIWELRRGPGGVTAWDEHNKLIVGSLDSPRPGRPPESAEQLGAAGVQMAVRWRSGPPRRIYLHGPMLGGGPKVDAPADTVEDKIPRKLRTLQRGDAADADARHLFVWADVSDFETFNGMDTELIAKARPPEIPHGIDTVWMARFDGSDRPTLWRCDRGGRWVSA